MSAITHPSTARPTSAEIVDEACEAFATRDAGALFARVAPEIAVFVSDFDRWGGVYQGIAEVHRHLVALLADRDLEVRMDRIGEVHGRIVTAGTVGGWVRRMGVPFEIPIACLWTVRRDAILGLEIHTGAAASAILDD